MDAEGDVLVAWTSCNAACDATAPAERGYDVMIAERPVGGTWSAPALVTAGTASHRGLELAVNRRGDAVLAWEGRADAHAAFRPAGGDWTVSAPLTAIGPGVAIAEDGTAAVAWIGRGDGAVHVLERRLGGTATEHVIREMTADVGTAVAVGSAGDLAVAAVDRAKGMVMAYRPAGAVVFDPVETVPGPMPARSPVVPAAAVDGSGRAMVAWTREECLSASDCHSRLQVAGRTRERTLGPPQALGDGRGPELRALPGGGALLAWYETGRYAMNAAPAEQGTVTWTRLAPGGAAGPARTRGGPAAPRLGVGPRGDALLGEGSPWASLAPPGGDFGAVQALPGAAGDWTDVPRPALNGDGDGVAVWFRRAGGATSGPASLHAAALDVTPPELRSPAVPQRGWVGQSLTMRAAAFDLWTPRPAVHWALSDGATGDGARFVHKFARPGRYRVEVTATDSAGHPTSTVRSVGIARRRIRARVTAVWRVRRRVSRLVRLRVDRVPSRARVVLRCTGRRCPTRRRVLRVRNGRAVLARSIRFRAGQRVVVAVTRPGWTPRSVSFELRRARQPRRRVR